MPGGDRTGPAGRGPMTGRGAGYCAGASTPGSVGRMFVGGGFGRGRGGGRGWRNRYSAGMVGGMQQGLGRAGAAANVGASSPVPSPAPAPEQEMSPEQEIDVLKQQIEQASASLEQLRQRMDELEAGEAE